MFKPHITVHLTKEIVWNGCIELCSANGRPFKIVNDSGFRKILDPILEALDMQINEHNIRNGVLKTAEHVKNTIIQEIKGKMLSLKLDGVTNNNRSFLGINLQFIENGRIHLRTLATREMFERHTGENLKRLTIEVLNDFGVSREQIYTCTTDNARNMIKAVTILQYDDCEEKEDTDSYLDEEEEEVEENEEEGQEDTGECDEEECEDVIGDDFLTTMDSENCCIGDYDTNILKIILCLSNKNISDK